MRGTAAPLASINNGTVERLSLLLIEQALSHGAIKL